MKPDEYRTSVSFLGLGSMGLAAAKVLLPKAALTVWNRTKARSEALRNQGAQAADNAAFAVQASPITIVSLVDNAAARTVLASCGNSLTGRIVVNLTNGTPADARILADMVAGHGGLYLHGAVMATPPMLGSGAARILLSGAQGGLGKAQEVLAMLGTSTYLGADPGHAPTLELGLLSIMYGLYGGFFHALATLEVEGMPVDGLMQIAGPWTTGLAGALSRLGEQVTSRAYDQGVSSSLEMQAVGMDHYQAWSETEGIGGSLMKPMHDLMGAGVAAGYGQSGIAAIYELVRPRR